MKSFDSGDFFWVEAEAELFAMENMVASGFSDFFLLECDALNVINPIDCSLVVPHWSINSVIEDIMESFLML